MKRSLVIIWFVFILFCNSCLAKADVYDEGIAAYRNGSYNVAEYYFNEAVNISPNNPRYYYYLAITEVKLGKIAEAERCYKKVISMAPSSEAAEKAQKGLDIIASISTNSFNQPTAMASVLYTTDNKVTVPIIKNNNAIIVSNVIVNNKMNLNFILDTGATYTSISKATAQKLGLELNNAPKISIKTANGIIQVPKVKIKNININGMLVNDIEATVHETSASHNITGLLGLSFLEHFLVTIDRKNGQVVFQKI